MQYGRTATPQLSVVMPVYNCARFIEAAVASILCQTHADFELLIVDDGSTDGTTGILRGLAANDARIRLIEQENCGIVASLNRMISLACGEFMARMDGDDISLPDRFARQIAHLSAHPQIGAVGTQYVEIDGADVVTDPAIRHPVGPAAVRAGMMIEQPFSNPTVMFRAAALRAAGGYREAFRYCEDYDLFLRLSRIAELDNLPDILLHYRRTPTQMSIANNSRQTRQAVKALFAHREVLAGRPDPFDGLDILPTLDRMDAHIGRVGVARALRGEIAQRLRFSPMALGGEEFAMIVAHARSGDPFPGAWRTVLRCFSLGLFARTFQLAAALLYGNWRAQPGDEEAVEAGGSIISR